MGQCLNQSPKLHFAVKFCELGAHPAFQQPFMSLQMKWLNILVIVFMSEQQQLVDTNADSNTNTDAVALNIFPLQ